MVLHISNTLKHKKVMVVTAALFHINIHSSSMSYFSVFWLPYISKYFECLVTTNTGPHWNKKNICPLFYCLSWSFFFLFIIIIMFCYACDRKRRLPVRGNMSCLTPVRGAKSFGDLKEKTMFIDKYLPL